MSDVLTMHNILVSRNGTDMVLDIADLTIKRGELLALVGPNGAGKSTLLQTINLLQGYQGDLRLFGVRPDKVTATDLRRRCSMVFQEALLLDGSVAENVAWPLRFRRVADAEIKSRVQQALIDFGCEHLSNRSAKHLSGGEAQRVCIARALATEPELLLLDEPFAALDIAIRSSLLEEIRSVAKRRGITVVLVSHSFSDVLDFAERAVVLIAGRIRQDNRPEVLLRRPVDLAVAQLVGMDNILDCETESEQAGTIVHLAGGISFRLNPAHAVPVAAGYCCLPGDALFLLDQATESQQSNPGTVVLDGQIQRITPGIGCWRVVVKTADLVLTIRLPREQVEQNLQAGLSVRLGFNSAEAQLLQQNHFR